MHAGGGHAVVARREVTCRMSWPVLSSEPEHFRPRRTLTRVAVLGTRLRIAAEAATMVSMILSHSHELSYSADHYSWLNGETQAAL